VPCYCPLPGCDFVASSEVLSNHVSCKHEDSRFLFVYGNSFDVSLKFDDEAIVLQEENDGKLYILTINSNLMGNAINISCIGPNSSEPGHHYDILAKSQVSKMKLQSVTKNIQQSTLTLASSEYLMIPFGFFESLEPKICITFKVLAIPFLYFGVFYIPFGIFFKLCVFQMPKKVNVIYILFGYVLDTS
jgi:E3 ubiquitin-protein ligase SIAH1